MKKAFFFLAMLSIGSIAHAQTDSSFTKGENNLEYKIYSSNQGELIKYGSFVKMHFTQMYRGAKDTVLYDSKDYASPIQPIDTANLPGYYYAILKQLRPNDSVDIRIIIDSAYKNSQVPMPPMFEKGNYLYTCIKIEDVFSTKEKADSAINAEQQIAAMLQAQKNIVIFAKETDVINQYMASNKITGAIKTPKGSFIKIIKKGVGKNATDNDKVKVNYTGQTLAGKVFDSNTDPNFGHVQPYEVNLFQKPVQVIAGWEEGLKYLNKGSKAIFFIPSPLGYGSAGNGPAIGPNEILIFDIEIVAITPVNAPAPKVIAPTKKPVAKPKVKITPKAKKK